MLEIRFELGVQIHLPVDSMIPTYKLKDKLRFYDDQFWCFHESVTVLDDIYENRIDALLDNKFVDEFVLNDNNMEFSGHREAYRGYRVFGIVWEKGCGCYIWNHADTFHINKLKVSCQKVPLQNIILIVVAGVTYDNQKPDEYISKRVQYTDSVYVSK